MKNGIALLLPFLLLSGCKLDLNDDPVGEVDHVIYLGKISEDISSMDFALYHENAVTNGTDVYELKMDYVNFKTSLLGTKSDGTKCQFVRTMEQAEQDSTVAAIKSVNLCGYVGPSYDCAASYLPSSYFIINTERKTYHLDRYFYYCRSSSEPSACDGADLSALDTYLTALVKTEIPNCQ